MAQEARLEGIELFELAQRLRRPKSSEIIMNNRQRVTGFIPSTELVVVSDGADQPQFIRLCSDSFPDLHGAQLRTLSELCRAAHLSAECFLGFNHGNQWVRTAIGSKKGHDEIFPSGSSNEGNLGNFMDVVTIYSNVLPCDPYWERLRAVQEPGSRKMYFPCRIIEEAEQRNLGLTNKFQEWNQTSQECVIESISEGGDYAGTGSNLLWEIRTQDVSTEKESYNAATAISLVKWRGGTFIRKTRAGESNTDVELDVMERFCHPHIIYGFGVSSDDGKSSGASSCNGNPSTSSSSEVRRCLPDLFLEFMQRDLETLIFDAVRLVIDRPPFSHEDSVDILLQVAEAVNYMHDKRVVHCDIKSANIFVREFPISSTMKQYVAKVGDFGSAHFIDKPGFDPRWGTTNYSAPEVLKLRTGNPNATFEFPCKVDVYSFGIVAFEVLTGEKLYAGMVEKEVKKRVMIDKNLVPPLRDCCEKRHFLNDERLISLIEKCWRYEPSERPSFLEICKVLREVKERILVPVRLEIIPILNGQASRKHRRRSKIFSCFTGGNVS